MNITITGSLGNISRLLVEKLVTSGHNVTVVSSQGERAKQIKDIGAMPAIGSLEDGAFVSSAFKDADAVYTMVPPDFSVPDYYAFADKIHHNYKAAIEQNDIKHVVNLSSVGVAFAGVEPLRRYYNLESLLDKIPGLNIIHLRPAMFYTNFYGSVAMVKHQGIMGHNLNGLVDLIMTHPLDIAEAAYTLLNTRSFTGKEVRYIVSDVKNGNEISSILSEATNKPLVWMEFADDALMAGLLQNGFSHNAAENLIVNAGKAIRQGLFDEFKKEPYRAFGTRKFESFAKEFAMALDGAQSL
jgi:uncharacterized protein YbjT (DUF2867 family)